VRVADAAFGPIGGHHRARASDDVVPENGPLGIGLPAEPEGLGLPGREITYHRTIAENPAMASHYLYDFVMGMHGADSF